MTTFSRQDSVARVIDESPEAARRLARRYPHIGCFASPEIAQEVTLEEAAHMAEVTPGSLLAFVQEPERTLEPEQAAAEAVPDWARPALEGGAEVPEFDARAVIEEGRDPKQEILDLAGGLPEGGVFRVEAPFDPVPLRNLLGRLGFDGVARRLAEGHWQVLFRRRVGAGPLDASAVDTRVAARAAEPSARVGAGEDAVELDLRAMEPPMPLVTILRRIDSPEQSDAPFVVRLDRDPVFLFPELTDRGWSWSYLEAPADEVRLHLYPAADGGGA